MKTLLKYIASAILLLALLNCTSEPLSNENPEIIETQTALDVNACVGENPEARITNNGTVPIDLDILNENGDVVGFVHNLAPGNTSNWLSFLPGEILFAVSNDFFEDEKVVYTMAICMTFDMEVDGANTLTSAVPILN